MLDENINNYVVTIFGQRYILKKYHKIIINNKHYVFLGIFPSKDLVPNVSCIYVYNDKVYVKSVRRPVVPKRDGEVKVPKTRMRGDEALLKIESSDEDDELMLLMKSLLQKQKITVGQFKDMYGENRKTDMNNDKSRLENKHTLSWNKFKDLLQKLGIKYDLIIYDKVGED